MTSLPQEVVLGNGTKVIDANTELKQLISKLGKSKIEKSVHFNPSLGPYFSGVHETFIRAAKRAIYGILSQAEIPDEDASTAFTYTEDLINSRLLTYQTTDIKYDILLTPKRILCRFAGAEYAPDTADTKFFNPKKRWKRVEKIWWGQWVRKWLNKTHK